MKIYNIFLVIAFLSFMGNLDAMENSGESQEEISSKQQELDRALINAIYANDVNKAKKALEQGANPCACGTSGEIPAIILAAIMPNALELIQLLVEHGADINVQCPTAWFSGSAPIAQGTPALFVFIDHNLAKNYEITEAELVQFMLLGAERCLPQGISSMHYPLALSTLLFVYGFIRALKFNFVTQEYVTNFAINISGIQAILAKNEKDKLTSQDIQVLRDSFPIAIAMDNGMFELSPLLSGLLRWFSDSLNLLDGFVHAALIGSNKALEAIYEADKGLLWPATFEKALSYALAQLNYESIFQILDIASVNKITINLTGFELAVVHRLSIKTINKKDQRELEYLLCCIRALGLSADIVVLNESLINAIQADDVEAAKSALANGAHADALNDGMPAIILAATKKHAWDFIKLLVACGADINTPNPRDFYRVDEEVEEIVVDATPFFIFMAYHPGIITHEMLTEFMMLGVQIKRYEFVEAFRYVTADLNSIFELLFKYGLRIPEKPRPCVCYLQGQPLLDYILLPAFKEYMFPHLAEYEEELTAQYQELQEKALSQLDQLQKKAESNELTISDTQLIQQAFLFAIAQHNDTILHMILEHFLLHVDFVKGFDHAALMGNTNALQAIFNAASNLPPETNLLLPVDRLYTALANALAQRHVDAVRWILHLAFQRNIALDLDRFQQTLVKRLALPRLAKREQKKLKDLVQAMNNAQAGRILSPYAQGLCFSVNQITSQIQRLPPELFSAVIAMLLGPLYESRHKSI